MIPAKMLTMTASTVPKKPIRPTASPLPVVITFSTRVGRSTLLYETQTRLAPSMSVDIPIRNLMDLFEATALKVAIFTSSGF
jgi:hypothetical protein